MKAWAINIFNKLFKKTANKKKSSREGLALLSSSEQIKVTTASSEAPQLVAPEDSGISMELNEIEYKYKADNVKLKDFIAFAESLSPKRSLDAASWDVYYGGNKYKLPFLFIRHRKGSDPELTIKMKTNEKDNIDRFEIDLKLGKVADIIVSKFCELFGFTEEFRIFKDCTIYWYEKVDLVYYVVYDENKKEKGRYIEIEAIKDAQFQSKQEAIALMQELEKKLSILGITPQNRMRKSQWEINKK